MQAASSTGSLELAFLVASGRMGDKMAINRLAKQCHKRFLAHSWRLTGNSDAAQDVVQQAWVEILRGLPKLRDDHVFLPWSYRIVTRVAARWIKRQQKRRLLVNSLDEESSNRITVNDSENRISIEQALMALPAQQQAALALFYREGFSMAEISVALDVPLGTVKSRLSHAREKLRDILERE